MADSDTLEDEVRRTEAAFAQMMADRDFAALKSFLAKDTIFFSEETPIRGSDAVAAAWKPLFESDSVHFSWEPNTVAVQDDGELALSSGPVYDPEGKQVAVFNSIWRKNTQGQWKIIFDKGGQYCP